MEFKKVMTIGSLVLASTFVLAACGGGNDTKKDSSDSKTSEVAKDSSKEESKEMVKTAGGELKDGTYTLEEKNFDDKGWKVNFSMTVKDGKITKSDYDYLDKDGKKKSEDKAYQKAMSEKTKEKIGPADYIPALNEELVKAQDAASVDVVSGATHSSEAFRNYAQQLVQAAQAGKTDKIEIDNNADLKDGTYSLETKNASNGWTETFEMVVADGKITESKYDGTNDKGELKSENKEYQENMSKIAKVGPADYFPALNKGLVEKQNPGEVEVVSGATHSSESFKLWAAQLINAAEKGSQDKIVVDNIVMSEKK